MKGGLSLDSKFVDAALEVSGEPTRQTAVTRALEEFIARRCNPRLLELMGKLEGDTGYDDKAERSRG
jgi:hypothetical protein